MKKTLFFIAISLIATPLFSQTKNELIKEAVMNYIDGTSYNRIEQIEKAFYPEANLYLDGRDDSLMVVPISKYISWFKDSTPGEFNGRIGNITSIEHFGNIATAHVELLIPARGSKYMDMFILKVVDGKWKIMSKQANSIESNKTGERILFVTSNAHFYGDSDIPTGNSFAEIVHAYDTFSEAGYIVDFVSPNGGAIPISHVNTSDEIQKKYLYDMTLMYALETTNKPNELKAENYKAVYFVGGGSAMFGVPDNKEIQTLAMSVYEDYQGVISSVCHGTAGIVHLKTKDGKYLVEGKRVNGYPDSFENPEGEYFKTFPFLIQKTIEEQGGDFKFSKGNVSHVEVDGNLITGQNHLSSKDVALKIIENLKNRN